MSIEVSGGAGGMSATFQDLLAHAGVLDRAGDDVRSRADDVAKVMLDDSVAAAALLCPAAVLAVGVAVGQATTAMLTVSASFEASALVLRATVETYTFLDAAQQEVMDRLAVAGGYALGMALPGLVVGGGIMLLSNPALVVALGTTALTNPDALLDPIFDNPWITEALAKSLPWIIQGSAHTLLGPALPYILSGGAWPTDSYEDALAGLITIGQPLGLFHDSGEFEVVRTDTDKAEAAGSVRGVFAEITKLYEEENLGQVQITERIGPDGTSSWIVQIPGTEEWSPARGDNPLDLTTNVTLMNGQMTVLQEQIAVAMHKAGIEAGDPVMLTGHSQGGIAAAAMATDPKFTSHYNVQSIVTGGSPIAGYDIPDHISVLSMEHDQDMVPMLDGYENPDRPHWVTVERDLSGDETVDPHAIAAHGTSVYASTGAMIDGSKDPSLQAWKDATANFFDDDATTRVERFQIQPVGS